MKLLPKAKNKDIVIQDLKGEVLIYNLITDKMYCLNETSAFVYQACNNGSTFDELKRKHRFTDDLICLALDELKANDLIEQDTDYKSTLTNLSRREAIRKVGLASMTALPVIVGLAAPTAAAAASGTCTPGDDFTDPRGIVGQGDACRCFTNVGVGNNCGSGSSNGGPLGTSCKMGCICVANTCAGGTCDGTCT